MTYDDRLRISTPEGVDFELTLAGLGSRVLAAILDSLVRGAVYIALAVLGSAMFSGTGMDWLFAAVYVPLVFIIEIGYDILFEVLNGGRTLGKMAAGLRVVRKAGEPVDLRSSAVRNLLRFVDGPLTLYLGGIISILTTSSNQRIGDLAAGTVVVRDRVAGSTFAPVAYQYGVIDRSASWDISGVTAQDVATLRRFLERRTELTSDARGRLAYELAASLRTKVAGVPRIIHPEAMIEHIVRTKTDQR